MLISCNNRPVSCRLARCGWVLLGVLLVALILSDLPVVHDHDEPGPYNEDCQLARLAAPAPGVSTDRAADAPLLGPAPHPAPAHPVVARGGAALASFESRAPPGPARPWHPVIC